MKRRKKSFSLSHSNYPYSCYLIIVVDTGVHIAFRQLVVKKKKADHHHYHHHRFNFKKKKKETIYSPIIDRFLLYSVFINASSTIIIKGKLRLRSSNFINFLFIVAYCLISSILLSRVKLSQNYSIKKSN